MRWVRIAVAIVVAIVWATVYLLAAFSGGKFAAPPELSGVMLAVVTWLLGSEFRSARAKLARVRDALAEEERDAPQE